MVSHPNNFSMDGKIRTKEKCPKCGGKFQGEPLSCPDCKTHPKKYYIDLFNKGKRYRLFADRQGNTLTSWPAAFRVIESIRYELDNKTFDPTKYVAADIKKFLFENRIESWHNGKVIEYEKGNLAKGYQRILKTYINHYYSSFFKGMDVRTIRTIHIKEFYQQLPKKSLKYTINIMNALENFFNTLRRDEVIDKAPIFPKITDDKKLPKWVDFYTQIKILKTIPIADRHIFIFLAWQGIRPGEARALKVKDIDLVNGLLYVRRTYSDGEIKERTKGKHEKVRAINPSLAGLLRRQCANKHPDTHVFISPRTGGLYSESAFKRVWEQVTAQGFIITPYQATRHSFASNLVNKEDANIKSISALLGHTDIRTTLKYAHSDIHGQRLAFKPKAKVVELKKASPSPDRHQDKKSG